ncbi:MAG TPA: DUF1254 domain-containing protein [Sulfurovum sp.]|nr:DUF1254 domain-containing protein [Sulfurovum sp.]
MRILQYTIRTLLLSSLTAPLLAAPSFDLSTATLQGTQTIKSSHGNLELVHNYPTDETSAKLFDMMDTQRAAQVYMWSQPLVSYAAWKTAHTTAYDADKFGDFVVFDSLKEKRGIVTANLTTPYIISFLSLEKAPLLIDYPAGAIAGGVGEDG